MYPKIGAHRQQLPRYSASPSRKPWSGSPVFKQQSKLLLGIVCILLFLLYNARRPCPSPVATRISTEPSKTVSNTVSKIASKVEAAVEPDSRFAIVTFVTEDKSYMHMSLENKHGQYNFPKGRRGGQSNGTGQHMQRNTITRSRSTTGSMSKSAARCGTSSSWSNA